MKKHWRFAAMVALVLMVGRAMAEHLAVETQGTVQFSFDQVEIRLLAKLVGELTGRRFVVDEKISGRVTVVTPSRIPVDQVYPLFVSILETSGFTVVRRDGVYEIVRLPGEGIVGGHVVGPGEAMPSEGLITKVIRLEHISAGELKKTLQSMVRGGKAGALEAFEPTNHLIITDTAESIRRIERIIAALDQPGASKTVEFVKLNHASAEQVAAQLMTAIRTGVSSARTVSQHMERLAGGVGGGSDVAVIPAMQANGLVLVGSVVHLAELRRIAEAMDAPGESGIGRLNAIFLRYLSAEEAAKNLNALLAKTEDNDQRARIAIEPNVPNNALIIDAAPQDFAYVKKLVDELDQAPQQVMVEIVIAEVALGKNLDLGVEWSSIQIPEEGRTTVVGRSRPGVEDDIMNYVTKGVFPQGLSLGVARGTYVDARGLIQPRIPVLLRALAAQQDINILSSVPLRAQNNTEASVSVVENIPVLRSTIEGGSGTARDVIQNIDRVDVGIKLKFTPHVNPDGHITMQLNPSIEAIVEEASGGLNFTPKIAKREVSTTVTVPDRATIVITGLIREDRIKVVNKVPLLGDIPLLGWLFRRTTDSRQKTNLFIFVTPHIVTSSEASEEYERQLIGRSGLEITATNVQSRSERKHKK